MNELRYFMPLVGLLAFAAACGGEDGSLLAEGAGGRASSAPKAESTAKPEPGMGSGGAAPSTESETTSPPEPAAGEEDGPEPEPEDTSKLPDELLGAVNCRERADTAYTNGRPSPIMVISIAGKPVAKAAGHAFLRLQAAARAEGIKVGLTSGFRTMEQQRYLYNCYRTGSCNNGNLAARPGYSNHQNGRALDISTSDWLQRNGRRFGFVRTVPSEPWHWELEGEDPGGPCSAKKLAVASAFESPRDGGRYPNGVLFTLAAPDARIRKVAYWAGSYALGTSENAADGFALRYTFTALGSRSVTAMGYDGAGKQISETMVTFDVEP
jgi:hypothetical protein